MFESFKARFGDKTPEELEKMADEKILMTDEAPIPPEEEEDIIGDDDEINRSSLDK